MRSWPITKPGLEISMIFCSYEDRPDVAVGIKLLLLSLSEKMPGIPIDVTAPGLAEGLSGWVAQRGMPNITVRRAKNWPGLGWNVKPGKLLEMLDEGHAEAVWIDSDIVVNGDFHSVLAGLTPETIMVGQEFEAVHAEGGKLRAEGWGLEFARFLPHTLNSGFIRVTEAHRPLLVRWQELLSDPRYLESQARPLSHRPISMVSDQDVLWALLASSEFAQIPLRYLKCGDEIIQNSGANGYRLTQRLRHLRRGLPPLIHILGKEKPWNFAEVPDPFSKLRHHLELVVLELSPYVAVSNRYAGDLGEPAEFLRVRTRLGRTCRALALSNPSLQGLPFSLLAECLEKLGRSPGSD